jgi:hypothetical protein
MTCKICETRRARRTCPAVGGEICSMCCGTERENTLNCPLDCVYLREARLREEPQDLPPEQVPNQDIRISDRFLNENGALLGEMMRELAEVGLGVPGIVDFDLREALDSLVRTYRTRESGLYYDSKPANLLAAGIHERVQEGVDAFRRAAAERFGINTVRDADVLGVLAFLQRVELRLNNGRRRGRAFLDFLRQQIGAGDDIRPRSGGGPPLVLP